MMRALLLLTVLLAGCASSPPSANDRVGDQVVTARLDEAPGINFGCGGIALYGPATYTVLDGPQYLSGKKIDVLVWCPDDSKRASPNFRIGQAYRLLLTKEMPYQSDMDQPLGANPYAFYLRGDPEPVAR